MPTNRQDAWSNDEDLLLAEIVLRYIREGGTQLQAFEEVGKQLSRTAAACGFRWNSYVRKQYKSGIELAKKQRKELRKQAHSIEDVDKNEAEVPSLEQVLENVQIATIPFDDFVQTLRVLYDQFEVSRGQSDRIKEYEDKIRELEKQASHLTAENERLLGELAGIEHDYKALLEIMEKARKMVILQEEDRQQKVKFQMDKNGNLERVEK